MQTTLPNTFNVSNVASIPLLRRWTTQMVIMNLLISEICYWTHIKYQLVEALIKIGKKEEKVIVEEGNLIPYLEVTYYQKEGSWNPDNHINIHLLLINLISLYVN